MPHRMMLWIVLSVVVVPATMIMTSLLSAQTAGSPVAGRPSAYLNTLSTYAQHADSPEGGLKYAMDLMGAAALHVSQGDAAELAHRLASADQVARHDPRQYIPEDAVAAAFNGLMAQIQDSHATPIQTDAQTVHRIRLVLAGNAPVLTSIKEHPTSCLPEEAVLLTILLTFNNGGVVIVPQGQPLPRAGESFRAESSAENAILRLDQYLDSHRTTANMVLFSKLLQAMGI